MMSSTRRLTGQSLAFSAAGAIAVALVLLFLPGCSGDEPGLNLAQASNATSSSNEAALSQGPDVKQVARTFRQLRLVTKTPVEVDQHFAMLCIGVQQFHVEESRKRAGPHALTAIRIYMNDLAHDAFVNRTAIYPVGSVIVKEKRGLEYVVGEYVVGRPSQSKATTPDGVGGMIKRARGYDPDHGDWEYFYFEDDSKIESGRIANCVQCHQSAGATDHVFGDWARKNSAAQPAR
jgi:hypothetical protein